MTYTHGELFAGIGGFGLGAERCGIKTLWRVEIDHHCQDVLRRHDPESLKIAYGKSFSDDEVRKIVSDSIRYRQLGNAVAVPCVQWIFERIAALE